MAEEKILEERKGSVHDHDIMDHDVSREEAMHMGELTEEELVIEKKLRRKIDSLIMPLVMLVYLMNYIGKSEFAAGAREAHS